MAGDHIAGDHTHTDITIGNIEELQQKYRPGTVSNRLLGNKYVLLDLDPRTLHKNTEK